MECHQHLLPQYLHKQVHYRRSPIFGSPTLAPLPTRLTLASLPLYRRPAWASILTTTLYLTQGYTIPVPSLVGPLQTDPSLCVPNDPASSNAPDSLQSASLYRRSALSLAPTSTPTLTLRPTTSGPSWAGPPQTDPLVPVLNSPAPSNTSDPPTLRLSPVSLPL